MDQEKYQQLVKIVCDINGNNTNTELDCLKLLFKKKTIKYDAKCYQLIQSLISSFIIIVPIKG